MLLSTHMGVDNLRVSYSSGSILRKVMNRSNAIFHALLNVICNQALAFRKILVSALRRSSFLWKLILVMVYGDKSMIGKCLCQDCWLVQKGAGSRGIFFFFFFFFM